MPMTQDDERTGGGWTAGSRRYALFILGLVALLNYADRQVLSILLEPIKRDLNASDTQMGLLTGSVFALFYVTAALPLARLADNSTRRTLIAACLAWWSAMTMLCGFAQNLWQMALARIGVAMGEAGAAPAGQAMIADIYPPERRGAAMGVWAMFQAIGVGVGLFLGGWLNDLMGWRGVLFVIGAPGLLVALALLLTVREPVRGMSDGTAIEPAPTGGHSTMAALAGIWRVRSARRMIVAIGLNAFTGYGIIAWAPSFFIRSHGLGTAATGLIVGLNMVLGIAASTVVSGMVADRLGRRDVRWRLRLSILSALGTVPTGLMFLLVTDDATCIALFFLFNLCAGAITVPAWALLMTVLPPHLRASGVFLGNLAQNLLGIALGPLVVGSASDMLAPALGGDSLRIAMAGTLAVAIAAAAMFHHANRVLVHDLAPVRPDAPLRRNG